MRLGNRVTPNQAFFVNRDVEITLDPTRLKPLSHLEHIRALASNAYNLHLVRDKMSNEMDVPSLVYAVDDFRLPLILSNR